MLQRHLHASSMARGRAQPILNTIEGHATSIPGMPKADDLIVHLVVTQLITVRISPTDTVLETAQTIAEFVQLPTIGAG